MGRSQITVDLVATCKIWLIRILSAMGNYWEFRSEEWPAAIYILEGMALACEEEIVERGK